LIGQAQADVMRRDCWADWLADGRFRGSTDAERAAQLARLDSARSRILRGAQLAKGHRVLDAGCGDGFLALAVARQVGPSGHVDGIDISPGAIALALAADASARRQASCTWHIGDIANLPFADTTFDAIAERSALMYVDDKRAVAAEYHRVLRRGAKVSIFEPINSESEERWSFDLEPIRTLHARVEKRRQSLRQSCSAMLNFDLKSLVGIFEDRFRGVEVQRDEVRCSPTSGDEWLMSLEQQPNPLWPSYLDIIETALGPDTERYLAFMREGVESAGYEYRCPTLFLVATK
jgi:SAM-dependent methyltransferase